MAGAVCAAALLVGIRDASAQAAGCTLGSSGGNVNTCISIIGQGLFVNEMTGSADVLDSTRTLKVCLTGPATVLPRCTDFEVIEPGGTLVVQWFPGRDVPPGEYCAETTRRNDDGSTAMIGKACESVHS